MSAKYVFVTGGVVSSLGKGLAAAPAWVAEPLAVTTGPDGTASLAYLGAADQLVAVQVTGVVPSGKVLPEGGEQTTGPVLPVAVALK